MTKEEAKKFDDINLKMGKITTALEKLVKIEEEYILDQLYSYLYQGELATTAIDSSTLSPYTMSIAPIFPSNFPFIYFKE